MYTLLAALCVLPCLNAFILPNQFGMDYMDPPDRKVLKTDRFGRTFAFDVSDSVVANGFGGLSRYSYLDSDPDLVSGGMMSPGMMGGQPGLSSGFLGGAAAYGMSGLGAGLGAAGMANMVSPTAGMAGAAPANAMTAGAGARAQSPLPFNYNVPNSYANYINPFAAMMG